MLNIEYTQEGRAPQDTKTSAEYQLPDYTEPEPTRWPRPPKEEGEATRNNVVMSAGKRSCPDLICYYVVYVVSVICYVTQNRGHRERG